jgi:hypothetical protein
MSIQRDDYALFPDNSTQNINIIILKIKIFLPWCDTVGKTFFDNVTAIINMNIKTKYNYTEKYCTKVCSQRTF